jgi:TRAP transporter TAXI family solute receptor
MTYKDLGKVEYLPFAESVDLMKNRQLNATLQSAGLGVASLKELSTATQIAVVSVPKEIVERIGPPFVAATIPANTYAGQDRDVPTAAVVNYLVTSSAVSDDLAYQMTRLILSQARRSSRKPPPPAARSRCTPARSATTGKRA